MVPAHPIHDAWGSGRNIGFAVRGGGFRGRFGMMTLVAGRPCDASCFENSILLFWWWWLTCGFPAFTAVLVISG